MKPYMRTLAIVATVAAPLAATPAFAGTVQPAPNGSYARQTPGARKLAPHWYGYHNWRSRDAFQTRADLHKDAARTPNGAMTQGHANNVDQPSDAASGGAHSVKVSSNGDYALSTGGTRQLAPHWYGYHNWRTANAFKTRVQLRREATGEQASHMASSGDEARG